MKDANRLEIAFDLARLGAGQTGGAGVRILFIMVGCLAYLFAAMFWLMLGVIVLVAAMGRPIGDPPLPLPAAIVLAVGLLLVGNLLVFFRKRFVLDKTLGTLEVRYTMPFCIRATGHALEDFERVSMIGYKAIGSDSRSFNVLVEGSNEQVVSICWERDRLLGRRLGEEIAEFLDVPFEEKEAKVRLDM